MSDAGDEERLRGTRGEMANGEVASLKGTRARGGGA